MASLLVRVAPSTASAEVQAERMAAEVVAILSEPGHPMQAVIPGFRAHMREAFEEAAARCGFTLDEPLRVSCWHRWTARLVFAYRRLTRKAFLARGGGA
ncbi:hypothetical protein [Streptomyces sp. NPDC001205]